MAAQTNQLISFTNVERVCQKYGEKLKSVYVSKLQSKGHIATGNLSRIAVHFNSGTKGVEVSFSLDDYYRYLEDGTKPHFPPVEAIQRWIEVKHILPDTRDGNLPDTKQLAYLIARKISKVGTKAENILESSISEIQTQFEMELSNALTEDVSNSVDGILATL